MSSAGLQGRCSVCLSRGRRVTPLGASRATHLCSLGQDVEATLEVCWECRTLVDKSMLFCERAGRSSAALHASRVLSASNDHSDITWSTLGFSSKSGYDHEFCYQDIRIENIKCQSVDLNDADETWIVIKQENTDSFSLNTAEINTNSLKIKYEEDNDVTSSMVYKQINTNEIIADETSCKVDHTQDVKDISHSSRGLNILPTQVGPTNAHRFNASGNILRSLMSEEDMLAGRELDRCDSKYVKRMFKCETCIVGFLNRALLEEHDQSHHSPEVGPCSCDICAVRFPSPVNITQHRLAHYYQYVCSRCGYTHRRLADVNKHFHTEHEANKTYKCTRCELEFISNYQRRYHFTKVHSKRIQCELCPKTFNWTDSFNRHMKIHAGLTVYECAVCDKKFRGHNTLNTHMRLRHEEPRELAFCAECNMQFATKDGYDSHLKNTLKHASSNDFKYVCDHCGKRFLKKCMLTLHITVVHDKIYKFKCHLCDKGFSRHSVRKKHILRVHEGVLPAKDKLCSICGKGFSSSTTLSRHMVVHTGERPYQCDICDATFNQLASLRTHQKLVHMKMKRTKKGWIKNKNSL